MDPLPLFRAFTLVEPGPVILVTTLDGTRPNIMTVSWTMVRSFNAEFALTTGPWNHSWTALCDSREFVLSFPTSDMIDMLVGIGMCSGADTDKFARFGLTAVPASHVRAPLIKECLANIECRVEELIERLDLVLLRGGARPMSTPSGPTFACFMLSATGRLPPMARGSTGARRCARSCPTGCRPPIAAVRQGGRRCGAASQDR